MIHKSQSHLNPGSNITHIGKLHWMSESNKVQRVISLIKMNCLPQRPMIFPMATDTPEKNFNFIIYICYISFQIVRHTKYSGTFKKFGCF